MIFFTERISLKNKNKYLAIHEYMQNFASIGVQWKCDHEPTCIGRKLASPTPNICCIQAQKMINFQHLRCTCEHIYTP